MKLNNKFGFPFQNVQRIDKDDERLVLDQSSGTLTIVNSQQEDNAKYICRAENGYGEPVIASAFISIRRKSRVIQGPKHVLFQVISNFSHFL